MASTMYTNSHHFSRRNHPNLKWAQRKDRLYLTIDLADISNEKIDLSPEGDLKF